MVDFSRGFTASYYATIVDPQTWTDTETVKITSGSIKRQTDGLMQSADIDADITDEKWIRVYMDARQDGDAQRVALFTGLCTAPERTIPETVRPLECFSVLKPAQDVRLPRGYYAVGNGGQLVKSLLSISPAPVEVAGVSASLSDYIIAGNGESHLSMVYKILDAINWTMFVSGDGCITVCPKPTEPIKTLTAAVIEPGVKLKSDMYDCPNIFRAVQDDAVAVAKDEGAILERGREVWEEETSCNLADESLAQYASRRLKELSKATTTISYTRRFDADIMPNDLVNIDCEGAVGTYRVDSQTITLGAGAKTQEEVTT